MAIKGKETWEFETDGTIEDAVLKISGSRDSSVVRVEMSIPGSGYGPNEQPDRTISATLLVTEWNELVDLVRKATTPSNAA